LVKKPNPHIYKDIQTFEKKQISIFIKG